MIQFVPDDFPMISTDALRLVGWAKGLAYGGNLVKNFIIDTFILSTHMLLFHGIFFVDNVILFDPRKFVVGIKEP